MNSTTLSAFFDELEKIGQGGIMGERLRLGATGPGATASLNQLTSGGGLSGGDSAGASGLNAANMGGAAGGAAGAAMGGGPGAGSLGAAGAMGASMSPAQAPTTSTKGGTSGESLLGSAARRPTASDLGI